MAASDLKLGKIFHSRCQAASRSRRWTTARSRHRADRGPAASRTPNVVIVLMDQLSYADPSTFGRRRERALTTDIGSTATPVMRRSHQPCRVQGRSVVREPIRRSSPSDGSPARSASALLRASLIAAPGVGSPQPRTRLAKRHVRSGGQACPEQTPMGRWRCRVVSRRGESDRLANARRSIMVHSRFEDMAHRRSVWPAAVALAALLGALGTLSVSAAPPAATDASGVTHWNRLAATTLAAVPGPNGGAPPAFQINMGIVQGAVYDAVNRSGRSSIGHICSTSAPVRRRRSMLPSQRRHMTCSLDSCFQRTRTTSRSCRTPEHALYRVRGLARSEIKDNAFKRQGIEIGHAAAKAMLDAREGDGRFGPSAWVPNSMAGHWQPLLNAMGQQVVRPDAMGGRRDALLHGKLLAVPFCATACARQPAVGGRVQ